MTPLGKLLYAAVLLAVAAIALLALWLGSVPLAAVAVGVGALFAVSAPFVLSRRWRPPPPSPASATRRPVRRRR